MRYWGVVLAGALSVAALSAQAEDVAYGYDALGRLISVAYTNGSDVKTITYAYDAAGNRTQVSVTGPGGNQPPVAATDTKTTPINAVLNFDPRTNDSDPDPGAVLTVTGVGGTPTKGTTAFTSSSVTYTPNFNATGADSFTYTLSDGQGGTATGTVNVTIGANTSPVATTDTKTTPFNTVLSFDPRTNDTDADIGAVLTVTGVGGSPTKGTTAFTSSSVTYTPTSGSTGADSFTYTLSDGQGGTATGTVNVTIQSGANQAPVAVNDSVTATKNLTLTVSPMANDTDPGDTFLITSASTPGHGTATVAGDGLTIAYAPTTGYTGTDSFTYTITDSGSLTATATVNVFVNTRPTVGADSYPSVPINSVSYQMNVLSNDSDANGDAFSITLTGSGPSHGTLAIGPGGAYLLYTPTAGYTGTDSFYYRVTDARGGFSNATVSVTVVP